MDSDGKGGKVERRSPQRIKVVLMDRKALRPRKIPKSGVKAAARLQKTRKDEWCWVRGWFYPDLKQNLAVGIVWVSLFSGIEIGGVFIHAETHFGGKRDFPG